MRSERPCEERKNKSQPLFLTPTTQPPFYAVTAADDVSDEEDYEDYEVRDEKGNILNDEYMDASEMVEDSRSSEGGRRKSSVDVMETHDPDWRGGRSSRAVCS